MTEVTPRARKWAVAAVQAACRSGALDLEGAEARLAKVYAAESLRDLYRAIEGLPHPPAPLVLDDTD